jgi:hypothetical protein
MGKLNGGEILTNVNVQLVPMLAANIAACKRERDWDAGMRWAGAQ